MSSGDRPRRGQAARRRSGHPLDLLDAGLPSSPETERLVLGSVLLDGVRFKEIAQVYPDDFSLEQHRRIFGAMHDLQEAGENIDRITVFNRLHQRNQHNGADLSYLVSLDDGMPRIPHLDSYLRILRKKSILRRIIIATQEAMVQSTLETAEPAAILASHMARLTELDAAVGPGSTKIQRVEDLESIFAKREPVEYLVKPELPMKAVVCLTGDSESGKTTLACAWARDVLGQGHAVLILDRDKNPRDRICDRLERLGIQSDGELLRVWDCEQEEEAPQPDHPIVGDWVKRIVASTGKAPLVIVDSLVSFFEGDEDENSAVDMRALFNRCRALTKVGATVIVIHHTNRQGQTRGSSDFKPASDQAFLVNNFDRHGGRMLDLMTLEIEKSRYGHSGRIEYRYASGKMHRVEDTAPSKTVTEQLVELLKAKPGILSEPFGDLAQERGLGRNRARDFLRGGVIDGTIRLKREGRRRHHFWQGAEGGDDDSDRPAS